MTSTLAEKLCEKGCPTRREPAKSDREATRGEFGASGPIQRQGSRSVYSIMIDCDTVVTRVLAKAIDAAAADLSSTSVGPSASCVAWAACRQSTR